MRLKPLQALAGLALAACVANPERPAPTPSTVTGAVFDQAIPPGPFVPATGQDLANRLAAGPITYVRSNGNTVRMFFNVDATLRVVNQTVGRTSIGSWTVNGDVACQLFPDALYCSRFQWLSPNRLVIQWLNDSGDTSSTIATQNL